MAGISKPALMRLAFDALYASGLSRLARSALQGQGMIFCLHHVVKGGGLQKGFAPTSNLEITPGFLDQLIGLCRKQGAALVSMDEVAEWCRAPGKAKGRFAAFTLDDGYRDNLQCGLPVFAHHNCPFTVYVAPNIADGICELWWRGLADILAKVEHVRGEINGFAYDLPTRSEPEKSAAWKTLAPRLQAMPEQAQRVWIRAFASEHAFDLEGLCRELAMTWGEIRELNTSPLATIGAHTMHHFNLKKLTEQEARDEFVKSHARIDKELGQATRHFAYPYGNTDAAGTREFRLCAEAGFVTGVTTRLGNLFAENAGHPFALPRIMVSGRFQKRRHIETLTSGLPAFLANKGKRLNVN